LDTPGLSDTGGKVVDVENLSSTTVFIKKLEEVHAFVFVINWQSTRFDDSTIATFKAFYTSFGNKFFNNVKFLFTKASKIRNAEAETKKKWIQYMKYSQKSFHLIKTYSPISIIFCLNATLIIGVIILKKPESN
jgi:hypothetical protein